jgi:hypothetical protein
VGNPAVVLALAAAAAFFVPVAPAASDPPVGEIFDHGCFSDGPDGNGVDDRYTAPLSDFAGSEVHRWTEGCVQKLRIRPSANNNGDAGMAKKFSASENQRYRAQAWVKVRDADLPFRARLTIHFWNASHTNFLGECNDFFSPQYVVTDWVLMETACWTKNNTGIVDVHIRANNGGCGTCSPGAGSGTVWVDRLRFARTD